MEVLFSHLSTDVEEALDLQFREEKRAGFVHFFFVFINECVNAINPISLV